MNGLLLVDKPPGPSSFDVVRRVRQVAKMKAVGHTGTLDPDATGLLGVALGKCTKLAQFLVLDEKVYTFEIVFGERTDSDDATGETVETGPTDHLEAETIVAVLPQYVGEIEQVPPSYSAIHIDGKRAYELARAGEEVTLAARPVTVHDLQMTGWNPDESSATFQVRCGSGTYVRSLARDIGASLGTVAHARSIRRLSVGPFAIERAVAFDDLDKETLEANLLTPLEMVSSLPMSNLDSKRTYALGLGQRVVVERDEIDRELTDDNLRDPVAVVGEDGELVGITIVEVLEPEQALLKPKRILKPQIGSL